MSTLGHLIEETAGAICKAFIFWNILLFYFSFSFLLSCFRFCQLLFRISIFIYVFRFIHFKFLLFIFVSYVLKKIKRISDMQILIFLKLYAFSKSNISFCSKFSRQIQWEYSLHYSGPIFLSIFIFSEFYHFGTPKKDTFVWLYVQKWIFLRKPLYSYDR